MANPAGLEHFHLSVGGREITDQRKALAWNGCVEHGVDGVRASVNQLALSIMEGSRLSHALQMGYDMEARAANEQAEAFKAAATQDRNIHWAIRPSHDRAGAQELYLWAPDPSGRSAEDRVEITIPFASFVSEAQPKELRRRTGANVVMEDLATRVRAPCEAAIAAVNHALHGHRPHGEDPHHRGGEEEVDFSGGIPRRGGHGRLEGWGLGSGDGLGSGGEASSESEGGREAKRRRRRRYTGVSSGSESTTLLGGPRQRRRKKKGGGGHPPPYSVGGSSDSSTARSRRHRGSGSGPEAELRRLHLRNSGDYSAENQARIAELENQLSFADARFHAVWGPMQRRIEQTDERLAATRRVQAQADELLRGHHRGAGDPPQPLLSPSTLQREATSLRGGRSVEEVLEASHALSREHRTSVRGAGRNSRGR